MTKYSDEQIRQTAREVVSEKPRYVYQPVEGYSCTYWGSASDPDGPGCVVGAILYRLGETEDLLRDADSYITSDVPVSRNSAFDGLISDRSRRFLNMMQRQQDRESPWRDAYDYAVYYC